MNMEWYVACAGQIYHKAGAGRGAGCQHLFPPVQVVQPIPVMSGQAVANQMQSS